MNDDRSEQALVRGLRALGTDEAPPLARLEALVRDVQAREAARQRSELGLFAVVAVGVTTLVLVALAQSPLAFAVLQVAALGAALVVGLRSRPTRSLP